MKKTEILVVGKHEKIMATILRLINAKPAWNATGAFSAEEALHLASNIRFALVVLGAGLTEEKSSLIKAHFKVPVIQHYGGGSGLLYAEIYGEIGE